jgi:hypothetical protein
MGEITCRSAISVCYSETDIMALVLCYQRNVMDAGTRISWILSMYITELFSLNLIEVLVFYS